MSKVIAFCGSKGSGKSTSAMIFKEVVEAQVEEIAIAGHLKEACSRVFNIDHDMFINPKLKEVELEEFIVLDRKRLEGLLKEFLIKNYTFDAHVRPHLGRIARTPRALLQYIGTEVLHPIDPLVHVKVAMAKKDPNKITLITDLRFVAEFEYLKAEHANAFVPVYVKNPAAEIVAAADAHSSERQYELFRAKCRVLNNEGSLSDLKSGINQFIQEL